MNTEYVLTAHTYAHAQLEMLRVLTTHNPTPEDVLLYAKELVDAAERFVGMAT